jgi:hypothetical protein
VLLEVFVAFFSVIPFLFGAVLLQQATQKREDQDKSDGMH